MKYTILIAGLALIVSFTSCKKSDNALPGTGSNSSTTAVDDKGGDNKNSTDDNPSGTDDNGGRGRGTDDTGPDDKGGNR